MSGLTRIALDAGGLETPLRGGFGNPQALLVELSVTGVGQAASPLTINGRQFNIGYTETSTPLGAAGTFTATARDGSAVGTGFGYFTAEFYADVAGTCYVEKSADTSVWIPCNGQAGTALTAGQTITIKAPLVNRYYRARYTNGAGAQAVFNIQANFFLA